MMCAHVFRYEFKTNHEEWVNSVKPKLGPDVSDRVLAAINTTYENMKTLYKVRTEMRAALQNLFKVSPIYSVSNGFQLLSVKF
jgi:hypothetical protein